MIMNELDLLEEACKNGVFPDSSSGEYALVNREALLELLRRKVKIQYSCRVIDIIPCTTNQEVQKYHRSQRRQTRNAQKFVVMDDERIYGPFDLVVVANGLFGGGKLMKKASLRIGDCRWHQERRFWFDFGITRIKRGADIAIQDGFRIGRQLEKNLHKVLTDNDSDNYDHLIDNISFLSSNDNNMYHSKFPIIFLILPAIMALLYHLVILNLSKE
mmetsp:Transcript_38515/g.38884  ORF Transcript_38515/g.38884 Transcript_38515/m.38884 type:complete len:216 (-) Transcript_38515:25-672(-)